MLGYLGHPTVWRALLLEHGCEKTHNEYMASYIKKDLKMDPTKFGWAR